MVSAGGPVNRSASMWSPLSAPTPLIFKLRVNVSGLYCNGRICCTDPLFGSRKAMPPLSKRGEPGKLLIDSALLSRQSQYGRFDLPAFEASTCELGKNI